ncbi:Myb/SANT-like domain containing protein [Quillaja saponaria]|uniref:Myb/SANT-like domain containing protein n=1 Tax=Quillaja saponaria TaxID=32244 RepID=A0AAD7LVL0_QUISA|nr:Myb/SANT-like domain containing protein [Quillaja saponaria]KAJ7964862.1 Myb/SANT-like domain containing protein [Quillaja saponaria]
MDTGCSTQQKDYAERECRSWSMAEESVLVGCLEEAAAKGLRCKDGTPKPGTLRQIEATLQSMFPESEIRSKPHIELAVQRLKTHCNLLCEMIDMSGFQWNDVKKCIEVHSDDIWDDYVQREPRATELRNMPFPLFERLKNVFEKNHVNMKVVGKASADVVEELDTEEDRDMDDVGTQQKGKAKRERRSWSKAEENALVGCLEEAVSRGLRCSNGTFKSGTLIQIEATLQSKFPEAGIRKCIEVDNDNLWDAYVQREPRAKDLRRMCFPLFERLGIIFGKDRPNRKVGEDPADVVEEVYREEERDMDDFGMQQKGKAKRERRSWSKAEENALVGCLEEAVAKGLRCNSGTLKPGTLLQIEATLQSKFPEAGIRVRPHIESAMKRLKTQYNLVCEMMNMSGFRWNDEKQCIEVDDDDLWDTYVQREPRAKDLRNMAFPLFERLGKVFGKYHANGKGALVPVDVETDRDEEKNMDEIGVDVVAPSTSINQTQCDRNSDCSHGRISKRPKSGDVIARSIIEVGSNISATLGRFSDQFDKIVERVGVAKDFYEDQRKIAEQLMTMDLTVGECVAAAKKIMQNPGYVHLFWGFKGEYRLAFVRSLTS